MIRRSAFTLIELLISASLFALVAVMIIGILATSSTVNTEGQQSQATISELQRSMDILTTSMSRAILSAPDPLITLVADTGTSTLKDSIVILKTNVPNSDGTTGLPQFEVYCVQTMAGHNQLVQFILPTATTTHVNALTTIKLCSQTSISNAFYGNPSGAVSANPLTSSAVDVPLLMVQPLQNGSVVAQQPDAYSIELGGSFYSANARATTAKPLPLILRDTVLNTYNPVVNNISQ